MVGLYRFILGYVRVRVMGEKPEKLMNYFIKNGISVWHIRRKNKGINFNMSMRDYLQMRQIRKKVDRNCKIKHIQKKGLPVMVRKSIVRIGVPIGIVLAILLNVFLSQYIWRIDVTGVTGNRKDEIIAVCNEIGIKEGTSKRNIDNYNLTNNILLRFNDVAWMSMNVEGSILTVNLSLAEKSDKIDSAEQGNLVANYDGVIRSCEIIKGKKEIIIGQAVKKGDILASGCYEVGEKTESVRAQGTVIAQTNRVFKIEVNKNQTVECETSSNYKNILKVFWFEVPLYLSGKGEMVEGELEKYSLNVLGKPIPVGIVKRKFTGIKEKQMVINEEEAKNIAMSKVADTIRMLPIESVESFSIITNESNEGYSVTVETVCLENIAKFSSFAAAP